MVTLHQTEVDGVRCFWVETGRPMVSARLMFRQGMADEPLRESGWLHLLEHLALHGRDRGSLQINGSVDLLTTAFDAQGPPELVAAHLLGLTAWLAAPTFGELDRERNVLRAEAELRGSAVSRALTMRYGARGPGVTNYLEPALGAATSDLLRRRAGVVFSRGNAVLALDGPPPSGLRLELPDGPLLPLKDAVPCEATPAAYIEPSGLMVSGLVRRSPDATFAPALIQRALTDRLRHQHGVAYSPWATYERVDAERAVVLSGSDLHHTGRQTLADTVLMVLGRLSHSGAGGSHLREAIESRRQVLQDPFAAFGIAVRAAYSALHDHEVMDFAEIIAELDATSIVTVQDALADFHASLLLGIPADARWEDQLPMLSDGLGEPLMEGRRFRSAGWPANKDQLIVGPTGLELRHGDRARTVKLDHVEGVIAFADGGRHLIRRDGYGISLEPPLWRDGAEAIAEVDSLVPAELRLPHPYRVPPVQFETPGWFRRWGGFAVGELLRPRVTLVTAVLIIIAVLCVIEAAVIWFAVYVANHPDSEVAERTPGGVLGFVGIFVAGLIVAVLRESVSIWRGDTDE